MFSLTCSKNTLRFDHDTQHLSSQSSGGTVWPLARQTDNVIWKLEWMKTMPLVWSGSSTCQLQPLSARGVFAFKFQILHVFGMETTPCQRSPCPVLTTFQEGCEDRHCCSRILGVWWGLCLLEYCLNVLLDRTVKFKITKNISNWMSCWLCH